MHHTSLVPSGRGHSFWANLQGCGVTLLSKIKEQHAQRDFISVKPLSVQQARYVHVSTWGKYDQHLPPPFPGPEEVGNQRCSVLTFYTFDLLAVFLPMKTRKTVCGLNQSVSSPALHVQFRASVGSLCALQQRCWTEPGVGGPWLGDAHLRSPQT